MMSDHSHCVDTSSTTHKRKHVNLGIRYLPMLIAQSH